MRKIDENDNVVDDNDDIIEKPVDMTAFRDKSLVESDVVDDPEFKAKLEHFVKNVLTGTSYKKLGYVDKDHWYITIA